MGKYVRKFHNTNSCFLLYPDDLIYTDEYVEEHDIDLFFDLEYLTSFEISQKVVTKELTKNSILCTNLFGLYLMNMENLLLSLDQNNVLNETIHYRFYSHAITAYFVKLLEKKGLICLEGLKEDETLYMGDLTPSFLNDKDKVVPKYQGYFYLIYSKIPVTALIELNDLLGITSDLFYYNPERGLFEYNPKGQFHQIMMNTFHPPVHEKGMIHLFRKDLTLWDIPFRMIKATKEYVYQKRNFRKI